MSNKFELPDLDEVLSNDDSNFNVSNDHLIDLEDEFLSDTLNEEELIELELEGPPSKVIKGMVVGNKVNNGVTVIKIQDIPSKNESIIQIPFEDPSINNVNISVTVEEQPIGFTKSNLGIYSLIEINSISDIRESIDDSNSQSNEVKTKSNNSITSFFSNAISAVKSELNGEFDDTSSNEDNNKEDTKKETSEDKEARKPKRNKNNSLIQGIKSIYSTIAEFILSIIMTIISFLSKIPIIGLIFNLLNKLTFFFKFLCYMWLPILLLFTYSGFNFIYGIIDIKHNTEDTINKITNNDNELPEDANKLTFEDTSIYIYNEKITDNHLSVDIKNNSSMYANFYLIAELKEKGLPFFSKRINCTGPTTVLGINETTEYIFICESSEKNLKVKSIDIIVEN